MNARKNQGRDKGTNTGKIEEKARCNDEKEIIQEYLAVQTSSLMEHMTSCCVCMCVCVCACCVDQDMFTQKKHAYSKTIETVKRAKSSVS